MIPTSTNQKGSSLALRTYRWEGLAFNLLCAIYYLTVAPKVVDAARVDAG